MPVPLFAQFHDCPVFGFDVWAPGKKMRALEASDRLQAQHRQVVEGREQHRQQISSLPLVCTSLRDCLSPC
jgi:hypothetical protein